MIILKHCIRMFLLAAALLGSLTSPGWLLAQDNRGELSLRMLQNSYYREAIPGESITLYLEIRNIGDKVITDISLNADKPEGWVVDFKLGSISYLDPGSAQMININITPSENALRGEYNITLLAEANETRTAISTVLRVERSFSFWLWVGLGLAVLVITGFVVIFLRFGRQ
ncbi:NEW3 domain-containing protein [Chloroflexota bacterium]